MKRTLVPGNNCFCLFFSWKYVHKISVIVEKANKSHFIKFACLFHLKSKDGTIIADILRFSNVRFFITGVWWCSYFSHCMVFFFFAPAIVTLCRDVKHIFTDELKKTAFPPRIFKIFKPTHLD